VFLVASCCTTLVHSAPAAFMDRGNLGLAAAFLGRRARNSANTVLVKFCFTGMTLRSGTVLDQPGGAA
jgi:hypothetical protein